MSGLRGDIGKIRKLEQAIRALPSTRLAHKVAAASAGVLTDLVRETFRRGENAYGDLWEPGARGQRVTLHKSGLFEKSVGFTSVGTRIRGLLTARYAKYQVGRRQVFPRKRLPVAYVDVIGKKAATIIRDELAGAFQ